MSTALNGMTVLDLTQFESGTVCTQTLAWFGANVIKIELPVRGELGRYSVENPGLDTFGFILTNANKKSVTINLKTPEGKKILHQLLNKADIFIENMGPGSIERLGFGYDDVKKINDKIVYAQIKGFGTDGPWADYPAFDPIACAVGGAASLTGEPDGPPMQPGPDVADSGAGYMTALAILAALVQRTVTGKGQRIEVAMQDVVIAFGRAAWEEQLRTGEASPRVGNGMPLEQVAPCNMYPCKPGGANDFVHIYASRAPGSSQWKNLLEIIGRSDIFDDPRFATPRSRYIYRQEVDSIISEWTKQKTKFEAMEELCKAGVPAGAVLSTADISADPYLRERGIMVEVEHPIHGKLIIPGLPIKMSDSIVPIVCSPSLGQHNEEVLKGLLNISDGTYDELRQLKVI